MPSINFPYKIYKDAHCPIINLQLYSQAYYIETEAYVDSGASVSLFSIIDAQRLKIDYRKGKEIFTMVGDGSLIPVYIHLLPTRIGAIKFNATIGFSERLGVGFNLLGRKDIFEHFDVTFSDSAKIISFNPVKR